MDTQVDFFCQWANIPTEVQKTLITQYPAIAANFDLKEEAFLHAVETKPSGMKCEELYARKLTSRQIDAVISSKEKRQGGLRALAVHNLQHMTDQQKAYLYKHAKGDLAKDLLRAGGPDYLLEGLGPVGGLVGAVDYGPALGDERILALAKAMRDVHEVKRNWREVRQAWEILFHFRPQLLDNLADFGSTSWVSAASALTLKNPVWQQALLDLARGTESEPYVYMAFIANPLADESLVAGLANHKDTRVATLAAKARSRIKDVGNDEQTLAVALAHVAPNRWRSSGRLVGLVWLSRFSTMVKAPHVTEACKEAGVVVTRWALLDAADTNMFRDVGERKQEPLPDVFIATVPWTDFTLDTPTETALVGSFVYGAYKFPENARAALNEASSMLGNDVKAWGVALKLLNQWTGSLRELCAVANATAQ